MRQGCGLSLAKASSTRVFVKLAASTSGRMSQRPEIECVAQTCHHLNSRKDTYVAQDNNANICEQYWFISTIAKDERLMVVCSVRVVLAQFDSPRTAWMLAVLATGCDSPGLSFLNAFGHYFYARSD